MAAELSVFDPERFQDVRPLGSGSHAMVFAAWDRDLERPVALKLSLRDTLLDAFASERLVELGIADGLQRLVEEVAEPGSRYTLLREARLLARVNHPNVVAVLDIGLLDGSPTMVLPYLVGGSFDGQALDGPWPRLLEQLLAVGEGLAAIHEAGLLHRDFKANNLLFDERGRLLIADLGLACHLDDHEAMSEWPGTPEYMAPEVLERRARDLRDDVYAFCMVAFRMVYGHPPFASARARSLGRVSIIERVGVPVAVRDILARGLEPDPARRWPDMPSLLAALRRTMIVRRRRWPLVAGLAGTLALGMVVSTQVIGADECAQVEGELASVWTPERGRELDGALGDGGASVAVDAWARRWSAMRRHECEVATAGGLPALPSPCAEHLRMQLATVLDVLARAETRAGLDHAALIAELGEPERCLVEPGHRGPEHRSVELREADFELEALIISNQLELADDRLAQFRLLAESLGGRRDLTLLRLRQAQLDRRRGRLVAAESGLELAFTQAVAIADDELATTAVLELVGLAGTRGRVEALEAHALVARALLERDQPERVPELLELVGRGLRGGDDQARARAVTVLGDAVVMREQQQRRGLGSAASLAAARLELARALHDSGEHEAALAAVDACLDIDGGPPELRRAGLALRIDILVELGRIAQAYVTVVELHRVAPEEAAARFIGLFGLPVDHVELEGREIPTKRP